MIPSDQNRSGWLGHVAEKIIYSPITARLANFPPIAYVIRTVFRKFVKVGTVESPAQEVTSERFAQASLQYTLDAIVLDVTETLGYVGAMVATYEPDGALPVLAWYAKPEIASREQILAWEAELSRFTPTRPISLTNPDVARVYVDDENDAENLSVKAYRARRPIASDKLYDLFRPVAPQASQPVVDAIQTAIGVKQVIAVPFFIATRIDGETTPEIVGNLFALKASQITDSDQKTLQAFGRQAAAAILSDRRRAYVEAILALTSDIQTNFLDEARILERIVEGLVQNLNYVGAMVATYRPDGALPVRAWYVKPEIASREQILAWEAELSRFSPTRPISLTNPDVARVYVDDEDDAENLSVRAYRARRPVASDKLYDLFRPVAPQASQPVVDAIQNAIGVRQVIAVPFFKENTAGDQASPEFVGNLFVLSRARHFRDVELRVLQAFGQQAAAEIRNAQLYRQTVILYHQGEDRRKAAEIFGKMAFSASASAHALRNKVGAIRGFLQLPNPVEQYGEIIFRNLDQVADILDTLHEPFQQVPDTLINVNACIKTGIRRGRESNEVAIRTQLSDTLPEIYGAQDMLIEVFKVLVKNAAEAVSENGEAGEIVVTSSLKDPETIQVSIEDNGIGIEPENQAKIFEMRWSTKDAGLGFGLFWTKDYIEGIGGALTVESTRGQGTTFLVDIPIKTDIGS